MTLAPTDVETRFDRTIDRWFRDQLALSPEVATFLGIHDHDGDSRAGGRDAVDEHVAFHRRAIDELSAIDPSELSHERALDRDLAIHQARLALSWTTEYRPWAGSSEAAEHIGESLFPLFTRDFAPLADRLESIVSRLDKAPAYLRRPTTASPIQFGCGPRSTSSRPSTCRPSSTRSWPRPAPRGPTSGWSGASPTHRTR